MLKALMLKRSLDAKRAELAALEAKDQEMTTREANLETAIAEVEPGNAEQEAAVTAEIEQFEADKAAHAAAKEKLSADIASLESELEELERSEPKPQTPEKREKVRGDMRMETATINIRALPMGQRAFDALPLERRAAIVAQPDVQEFLAQLRSYKGQSRAVTGAELTSMSSVIDLVNNLVYDKVDALVLDGAVADEYLASNPDLAAVDIDMSGYVEPYRVWVAKGDPNNLLPSINETIAKVLEDGTMDAFIAEADELSAQALEG